MAQCKSNKMDSNFTELRYAEEECLKQLPANPVWNPLEPNSYQDFGSQITTTAREPISASRQRKKGSVTDLEASGGFNQDLTVDNSFNLLQGFMFADVREKATTKPTSGEAVVITGVTGASKTIAAAKGLDKFKTDTLVKLSGFKMPQNNGVFTVASSTATTVVTTEALVDETPTADAKVEQVGIKLVAPNLAMQDKILKLTGSKLNELGLIPGEWVFIGGDTPTSRFANNVGFARVMEIQEGYILFDKTSFAPKAEVGTGKTIEIYFGSVLKNESDPSLIKRRSYQLERYLGNDENGKMSEYLVGAIANELTINVSNSDKVTIDMSFVALDNEQRDGSTGLKAGTRPTGVPQAAFNTSSDFSRIKLAEVVSDAAPNALFAFATELSITINNNVTASKAIGVLGGMDAAAGMFEVGGNMTAYFADIKAVQAVRNNADVTLDIVMVNKDGALLFDIPLLTLGDGRLNVEKDQAIMLPLETQAVESAYGHTLLIQQFKHLPKVAQGV